MRILNLFGFEWIAEYIAQVTNEFLKHAVLPDEAASGVQGVIREMADRQKHGKTGLLSEECLRKLLFDGLEFSLFTNGTPEAVEQIPFPKAGVLLTETELAKRQYEVILGEHSTQLERFKSRARNPEYADRLVNAARALEGWFHWVKSGPTEGTFFPREKTSEGETNDFVLWIHGRGDEPAREANMNCWEAVFFAAYKAGLMSIAKLRAMLIKATMSGRAQTAYFESLTDSLGYQNSFPYVPTVSLNPVPGDIVFIDRDHHVALCVENGLKVTLMSHWKYPRDGFNSYNIEEFTQTSMALKFGSLPV
jgi:hypothetical protein